MREGARTRWDRVSEEPEIRPRRSRRRSRSASLPRQRSRIRTDGGGAVAAPFDSGDGGKPAPFVEPDVDWVDDPDAVVSDVGEPLDPDQEEVPTDGLPMPVHEVGEFLDPNAG